MTEVETIVSLYNKLANHRITTKEHQPYEHEFNAAYLKLFDPEQLHETDLVFTKNNNSRFTDQEIDLWNNKTEKTKMDDTLRYMNNLIVKQQKGDKEQSSPRASDNSHRQPSSPSPRQRDTVRKSTENNVVNSLWSKVNGRFKKDTKKKPEELDLEELWMFFWVLFRRVMDTSTANENPLARPEIELWKRVKIDPQKDNVLNDYATVVKYIDDIINRESQSQSRSAQKGPSTSISKSTSSRAASPRTSRRCDLTVETVLAKYRTQGNGEYEKRWVIFRRRYYDFVLVGYKDPSTKPQQQGQSVWYAHHKTDMLQYIRQSKCITNLLAVYTTNRAGPGNPRRELALQRVTLDSFAGDPFDRFQGRTEAGREPVCVGWKYLNRMELLFYLIFAFSCDPFHGEKRDKYNQAYKVLEHPRHQARDLQTVTVEKTRIPLSDRQKQARRRSAQARMTKPLHTNINSQGKVIPSEKGRKRSESIDCVKEQLKLLLAEPYNITTRIPQSLVGLSGQELKKALDRYAKLHKTIVVVLSHDSTQRVCNEEKLIRIGTDETIELARYNIFLWVGGVLLQVTQLTGSKVFKYTDLSSSSSDQSHSGNGDGGLGDGNDGPGNDGPGNGNDGDAGWGHDNDSNDPGNDGNDPGNDSNNPGNDGPGNDGRSRSPKQNYSPATYQSSNAALLACAIEYNIDVKAVKAYADIFQLVQDIVTGGKPKLRTSHNVNKDTFCEALFDSKNDKQAEDLRLSILKGVRKTRSNAKIDYCKKAKVREYDVVLGVLTFLSQSHNFEYLLFVAKEVTKDVKDVKYICTKPVTGMKKNGKKNRLVYPLYCVKLKGGGVLVGRIGDAIKADTINAPIIRTQSQGGSGKQSVNQGGNQGSSGKQSGQKGGNQGGSGKKGGNQGGSGKQSGQKGGNQGGSGKKGGNQGGSGKQSGQKGGNQGGSGKKGGNQGGSGKKGGNQGGSGKKGVQNQCSFYIQLWLGDDFTPVLTKGGGECMFHAVINFLKATATGNKVQVNSLKPVHLRNIVADALWDRFTGNKSSVAARWLEGVGDVLRASVVTEQVFKQRMQRSSLYGTQQMLEVLAGYYKFIAVTIVCGLDMEFVHTIQPIVPRQIDNLNTTYVLCLKSSSNHYENIIDASKKSDARYQIRLKDLTDGLQRMINSAPRQAWPLFAQTAKVPNK